MSVIQGKNVWLHFLDSDNILKPLACARSCSLVTETDLSETSTQSTGVWKTYRGDRNGWRVTCDGLQSFDMNMAIAKLRTFQFAFTRIFVSFNATDDNAVYQSYQGYVLVDNVDDEASYNDLYKYAMSAVGDGELVLTDIPFDPDELPGGKIMIYKYDGTGSETDGNTLPAIPTLDGKDVLGIERDGWYHRKVENSPVGRQFTFATSTNIVVFAEDLPAIQATEMIDIFYQNT